MPLDDAVERAITECINEGILADSLSKNRAEAMKMSIYEYNEQLHMEMEREEGRAEGLKEGLEKGLKQGLDKGLKQGHEKGLKEGRDAGIELALKILRLHEEGRTIESIAAETNEPADQIRKILRT